MREVGKNGNVKLVGQQQIIQFVIQPCEQAEFQPVAEQRQVNVRPVPVVPLGTRAIQHSLLNLWIMRQHRDDALHGLGGKTVVHFTSLLSSSKKRRWNASNSIGR